MFQKPLSDYEARRPVEYGSSVLVSECQAVRSVSILLLLFLY